MIPVTSAKLHSAPFTLSTIEDNPVPSAGLPMLASRQRIGRGIFFAIPVLSDALSGARTDTASLAATRCYLLV
jgi:hypothetical protein